MGLNEENAIIKGYMDKLGEERMKFARLQEETIRLKQDAGVQRDDIRDLCIEGLCMGEGRRKQWCLEQILEKLGYNVKELLGDNKLWDAGAPP